jgi:cell fate regulator YaaT (PSP1 superfamily)
MVQVKDHRIVSIRFQHLGKLYHFRAPIDDDIKQSDYVIVSTSRGREMGQVITFPDKKSGPRTKLKSIDRRATPQDLVMSRMWQGRELEAMINCRAKAAELGFKMIKIARAEFSFDGARLTFHYSGEGDEKIDLKSLQDVMRRMHRKSKVEFHQVGPRDLAKIIGGIGACGLEERCCSKFLSEFSPISIRMAKAQGISLNPQEITGMCGRLRCCLIYEYEQYTKARKGLPKKKKRVVTPQGEGIVIDVLPLKEAVLVRFEDGKRIEFLKHEIQPYDELKALQKKANEPCDRHEGGGCDCGRDRKK